MVFGFLVSRSWILYSNRKRDSRFLGLYSGFRSPGFLILLAKIFRVPESLLPYTWGDLWTDCVYVLGELRQRNGLVPYGLFYDHFPESIGVHCGG